MDKDDHNSKARILQSAIKLFAQKGYDGVGIREICKDANANISLISYYWGGKQELYQGIIDDLIEKQITYAKSFLNLELKPSELKLEERIDLLFEFSSQIVDYLYSHISDDLITLLLKEQQNISFKPNSPIINYLIELIKSIFTKLSHKEVIYIFISIIAQINSPKILKAFSLGNLNQNDFLEEDLKIIKKNLRLHIQALIREYL